MTNFQNIIIHLEKKIKQDSYVKLPETPPQKNDNKQSQQSERKKQQVSQKKENSKSKESNKKQNSQNDKDELSEDQLSEVVAPFVQPLLKHQQDKHYTLVLDLDETLVHYQELADSSGQFLVRPYAEAFLEEMAKYFEIIIFTAALKDYADWILEKIDVKNNISHKLYRQHATNNGTFFLKDLSKIGRDLRKIIIVDNLPENFQLQPENGIFIQSWYGEPDDQALYDLAPLLKQIVIKKFEDVREALNQFRNKMIENINKGMPNPHLNLVLEN